mgnify:CR=1 FL=1
MSALVSAACGAVVGMTWTMASLAPERAPRSLASSFASGCVDLGISVDGAPQLVAAEARVADLLAGEQVAFTGCAPLLLDGGWHELDAGSQVPVTSVALRSDPAPGSPGAQAAAEGTADEVAQPELQVVGRQPTQVDLVLDAPNDTALVGGWIRKFLAA